MKKTLALDIGDVWIGTALSDFLGITCKPHQTVELVNLKDFLTQLCTTQPIGTIVVGYPKTLSGTESDQTKKVLAIKQDLENHFTQANITDIQWVLWDERLSSKNADQLKGRSYNSEEKRRSHSVAAAIILQNYLDCKSNY